VPVQAWGLIGLLAVLVAAVIAYKGPGAFAGGGYELRAVFTSDAQLAIRSPVRIAGVPVGTVTAEQPVGGGSPGVVVTMAIDPGGLPIHADATAQIRPRLVLEGNFYVDLHPGTPAAPLLASGGELPASQTSGPVQLDRVLSSLGSSTRSDLQRLIQGIGGAYGAAGGSGNASEDPRTRGLTAGVALHRSLVSWPGALRGLALSTSALQGDSPHALAELVAGSSRVFAALASRRAQLGSLVTSFDRTTGALAAQQASLARTVALLPGFLAGADTLDSKLGAAIPPTRAFARRILPALRALPATISAGNPWITQLSLLLAPNDLGGLASELQPAVRDGAAVIAQAQPLVTQLDLLDRCLLHNPLPTADQTISDPPLHSGGTVLQEAMQGIDGILGAAGNFDGNGYYVRGQTAGGAYPIVTSTVPQQGPLRGNALLPPLGTRPAWPGHAPPISDAVSCARSAPPDLNAARTGAGP